MSAIKNAFSTISSRHIAMAAVAVSVMSLAAAYTAEYGFGLLPCILCLYQRIPFAAVILLGGAACLTNEKARRILLALCGAAFAAGAAIAFFHSGVELHWWKGTEACNAPLDTSSFEALREQIAGSKIPRCDTIPWSLFGLSMANYNVLMSAGLSALTFIGLKIARKDP